MDNAANAQPLGPSFREPPQTILSSLRFLGPGFILSASIVGSGELIMTTSLGAKAGFALLWVILLGCLAKVAVQLEYGRYCISHGRPSFQAWNSSPGVKLFGVHWTMIVTLFFLVATFAGQAGVLGGSAQVAAFIFPAIPLWAWIAVIAAILSLLVFHGQYGPVELVAAALNFIFISAIFYCVASIQTTPYAFSLADLGSGLTFRLPAGTMTFAVAAFGITGVASGEICMYPYWCIEKGYAAWTGPRDGSPDWTRRAKGWIRVMNIDAIVSLIVYTLATCAFYILGAAVLRSQPKLADGNEFILQLSSIFTEVLGPGARSVFMLGAFTVLFSTIFANTAGFSRLWTDMFAVCGLFNIEDRKRRLRSICVMAWVFPAVCGLIYLTVQKLLILIVFMGVINSLFLLVVAWQGIVFRYYYTYEELKPSRAYDIALWISILSIGFMAWRAFVAIFH